MQLWQVEQNPFSLLTNNRLESKVGSERHTENDAGNDRRINHILVEKISEKRNVCVFLLKE